MTNPRHDAGPTLGRLSLEAWKRLGEITDLYEQAWPPEGTPAEPVDLMSFLPPADDPLRPIALHELIKTDLEIGWRRGQRPTLERYLERFPELGIRDHLAPQLLYEEYCVRQRYGDQPSLDSYRGRFPTGFAELERLIREQPLATLAGPPGQTPASQPAATAVPLAAAPPPPGPVGPVVGDHKLIKRIGSGGFGEVWRAEAPGGVEVAIKVIFRPIEDDEAKRELQSLEIIKNLRHPYLLQTHRFQSEHGRLYIVMELADGSLRDRLKECRAQGQTGIPAAELLGYLHEAAEALDFLHARKVMHRDIKPENILLTGRHVKVADFGLARLQQNQRSATASGSGTPAYMAPEVWRGKVSVHSDQYSLAATYVELRLDRRAFAGGDMMELMFNHVQNKPNLAPLSPDEQAVLFRALSKEPAQRYASCQEFVQALAKVTVPDQVRAPSSSAHPAAPPMPATDLEPERRGMLDTLAAGSGLPRPAPLVQTNISATDQLEPQTRVRPVNTWKEPISQAPVPASAQAVAKRPGGKRLVVVLLCLLLGGGGISAVGAWLVGRGRTPDTGKAVDSGGRQQPTPPLVIEGPNVYLPPTPGLSSVGRWVVVPRPGQDPVAYNGRVFERGIAFVFNDGARAEFVLIPPGEGDDLPPFYILEGKVSNGLFKRYAAGRPVKNSSWKLGAIDGAGKQLGIEGRDDDPVFNVDVVDAWRFAVWLGGELPRPEQWDKAAGAHRAKGIRGAGPFHGPWIATAKEPDIGVALGQRGPLKVGQGTKDVSYYGVHDMAGNGQEWTRRIMDPLGVGSAWVPLPPKASYTQDRVLLRGRAYDEPEPLSFADLEDATKTDTLGYTEISPKTSFRIVIEPAPSSN